MIPPGLHGEDFKAVWATWLEYCREKGKASTPVQSRMALTMLEGWGKARAIAALNHTMTMGWTGIAEPKGKDGKSVYVDEGPLPFREER